MPVLNLTRHTLTFNLTTFFLFWVGSLKIILPGRGTVVIAPPFLLFRKCILDLSRVGIAFWGVSPWGRKATLPLDLKPVMRIKARVKQVKTLPPGFSVGYGGTFTIFKGD